MKTCTPLNVVAAALGLLVVSIACSDPPGEDDPDEDDAGGIERPDGESRPDGGEEDAWQTVEVSGSQSEMLDVLWVIDNSSSMCTQQAELRANFDEFLQEIADRPADVQMGVTTTQFGESFYEEIARSGHLQSTPHPPVGPSDQCRCANPGDGEAGCLEPEEGQFPDGAKYTGRYAPVRRQIEAAVECTAGYSDDPAEFPDELREVYDPDQGRVAWSDDEMACALEGESCQAAGIPESSGFDPLQLFPCGHLQGERCDRQQLEAVYRDIPNVLEAGDYTRGDGSLDTEALRRDFQCMSYVGTRGSGIEQGLRAAAEAVHPRMTGGTSNDPIEDPSAVYREGEDWSYPDGDPSRAPNHGLLREQADTAVVFVTDENDCSHDRDNGRFLAEEYGCSEMNCVYAARETREASESEETPLVRTDTLADRFMENLARSKRVDEIAEDEVVVASIHGFSRPYTGEIERECDREQSQSLFSEREVCETFGLAYSGDRYEDYLLNFERILPERGTGEGDAEVAGEMCNLAGFSETLVGLAGEVDSGPACLDEYVSCATGLECPRFRYGDSSEVCAEWPANPEENYCKSSIEVRLAHQGDGEAADALGELGICYGESIGAEQTPQGCVVDREAYSWTECRGSANGVALQWNSEHLSNPARQLSDIAVRIAYRAD